MRGVPLVFAIATATWPAAACLSPSNRMYGIFAICAWRILKFDSRCPDLLPCGAAAAKRAFLAIPVRTPPECTVTATRFPAQLEFVPQNVRDTAHREFAGGIGALPGRPNRADHSRKAAMALAGDVEDKLPYCEALEARCFSGLLERFGLAIGEGQRTAATGHCSASVSEAWIFTRQ